MRVLLSCMARQTCAHSYESASSSPESASYTRYDADKFISYVDSIAITIIILINATIAAVTENSANDALEALSSLQSPMCTVIRDGQEVQIESSNMVRGDVVKL